jgi:hypothetical protein
MGHFGGPNPRNGVEMGSNWVILGLFWTLSGGVQLGPFGDHPRDMHGIQDPKLWPFDGLHITPSMGMAIGSPKWVHLGVRNGSILGSQMGRFGQLTDLIDLIKLITFNRF